MEYSWFKGVCQIGVKIVFFFPEKKHDFKIFVRSFIFRVGRCPDIFLIRTHRERAIALCFSLPICTLDLPRPLSMKRLSFFPSRKCSFLMIFDDYWWFLKIFLVFWYFTVFFVIIGSLLSPIWLNIKLWVLHNDDL